MNQYELALVVNAKVEDDVKTATVEAAKDLITRFGGVITNVEDWGKKRLAYDERGILFLHSVRCRCFCSIRN